MLRKSESPEIVAPFCLLLKCALMHNYICDPPWVKREKGEHSFNLKWHFLTNKVHDVTLLNQ